MFYKAFLSAMSVGLVLLTACAGATPTAGGEAVGRDTGRDGGGFLERRIRARIEERVQARQQAALAEAEALGLERRSVTTPDGRRGYLVLPPPGGTRGKPVVIVLHGGGLNAMRAMSIEYGGIWNERAQANGFTVVYPNGSPAADDPDSRHWNDCRAPSRRPGDGGLDRSDPGYTEADDVAYVSAIVADLVENDGADASRVYAVGSSNGGFMSFRLLREAGELFAGIAPSITGSPLLDECRPPTVRKPVLFTYGDADPFIPPEGGCVAPMAYPSCGRGRVHPAAHTIDFWSRFLGATERRTAEFPDRNQRDSSTQTQTDFLNAEGEVVFRVVRVNGGGHTAPAPEPASRFAERIFGARNADRPAADYIIEFFGLGR